MMTKKQLIQALSVLQDEDQVMACYKGKYTSEIDSCVTGVKIIFKQGLKESDEKKYTYFLSSLSV